MSNCTDILAMLGLPSGMELIVILAVGLLIFGKRIPEVARSFGRSIIEFKAGMKEPAEEKEDPSKTK